MAFAGCGVREMRMGTDSLLAGAFEENYVSETSTEKPKVSKWRSRDVVFVRCEWAQTACWLVHSKKTM